MDFSVQNLSNNENEPCIYLSLQSNNVLLDCSLQRFSKKLFKTPNFTQQISKEIDFVLITNYNHLLALPFLTEFTDFNGKIFATEPVAEFGKLMMLELVTLMKEEQNPVFFEGKFTSFYDVHDVESCVSKIKRLHFSENVQFNDKISFTPLSSGFSLGSSNWIINYLNLQVRVSTISEHSISYMSNSSFSEFGHASAFEQNLLNNNDYFIFNNISVNDGQSRIKKTLEQICSATSKTIQDKGNVIFPISPFGYAYDLINLISTQLETIGFGHIPIHVVSPVAKFSFHMANIFGEWMNKNLQNNLYFSKKPLKYGNLIENGLLHFHEEASTIFANFQGPFIIFITHPSLELGEAGILLQELRYHRASSVICTDSNYNYQNLGIYLNQPNNSTNFNMEKIKFFEFNLNFCLTVDELFNLISISNTKNFIFPNNINPKILKTLSEQQNIINKVHYFSEELGFKLDFKIDKSLINLNFWINEKTAVKLKSICSNSSNVKVDGNFELGLNLKNYINIKGFNKIQR